MRTGLEGEPEGLRPGVSVAPCESRLLALRAANATLGLRTRTLRRGGLMNGTGSRLTVEYGEGTGCAVPREKCTDPIYESAGPPWRLELPMSGSKIPESDVYLPNGATSCQ